MLEAHISMKQQPWSSGRILARHAGDPGSIPGGCILFLGVVCLGVGVWCVWVWCVWVCGVFGCASRRMGPGARPERAGEGRGKARFSVAASS